MPNVPDPTNPHPSPEDWITLFYGEMPPEEQQRLRRHAKSCAGCARQLNTWQNTRRELGTWKIPSRSPDAWHSSISFRRPLAWAAAAVFLLGIGLVLGRLTAPSINPAQLRAELRDDLRQEMASEMARVRQDVTQEQRAAWGDLSKSLFASARDEMDSLFAAYAERAAESLAIDRRQLLGELERAETQRQEQLMQLRRDLETVALFTDAGLRDATARIVQFVNPETITNPDSNPTTNN